MLNLFKKKAPTPDVSTTEQAHVYALDVLSQIGVVEALANLHLMCLETKNDAETRGVVIGGFRTVGLGAALVARYMQTRGETTEQIGKAYYAFINDSAIRRTASDFGLTALPDDPVYLGVIEKEEQVLLNKGYEIGHLHEIGEFGEAFEVWRDVMKMDVD